ncbi:DNRLRE domain-containing protein [Subtercola sp. PAMC28395]|uniref:CBM96 family carbohydrate-binding protein n=1 Tax=Subtercola sp. PAMC28395 TaxID=2846775 RepID=UPI001C0AA5A3|nr:DNRLRE domain-containing protein [Subtercola sp. PAMC28395]QWT24884.1 DNRLRE domain-containing protein [Subtercola sp. PAMC28395]
MAFPDWNPDHFIDTAQITEAFAISYDWAFDYWTSARRGLLVSSIQNRGLNRSIPVYQSTDPTGPYAYGGNWAMLGSNWNVVSNSDMALGALAVASENSTLANTVLNFALNSLPIGVSAFAPSGGYGEGLNYWDFASNKLVTLISSLRTATGSDYGLSSLAGVSEIGYFGTYLRGASGVPFNFGDADPSSFRPATLLALGKIFNNPTFTYAGAQDSNLSDNLAQRLIWFDPSQTSQSPTAAQLPMDKYFSNAGVGTFRSSWTNPNATFVGERGASLYSPSTNGHQQLDAGSFVLDALGQNWAVELGKENDSFSGLGTSDRWNYLRERAEGQNTLVINPSNPNSARVDTPTGVSSFSSNSTSGFMVTDLSAQYPDVSSWKRGVQVFDFKEQTVVQDEIVAPNPVEALWSMHTKAAIKVAPDGRSAILTQNGVQLLARINSADPYTFVDAPAGPLPTSPSPVQSSNDGVRTLAIRIQGQGNITVSVQFSPVRDPQVAPPVQDKVLALDQWQLRAEGTSSAAGITVGSVPIANFAPAELSYDAALSPTATQPVVEAQGSPQSVVTSTPASSLPGWASTTITEPGMSPRTYRVFFARSAIAVSAAAASWSTVGTPPESAIDGNESTWWGTWGDQSLTISLVEPEPVRYAQIFWRGNGAGLTKFEIQTSMDKTSWATQVSSSNTFKSQAWQTLALPAGPISKYVRLVVHGDGSSDLYSAVIEAKFFSYDITQTVSSPISVPWSVTATGVPGQMTLNQTAQADYIAKDILGALKDRSSLSVKYSTSDPNVASVSSLGLVTARGAGSIRIGVTVTSIDGTVEYGSVPVVLTDPTRFRIYASEDSYVQGGATASTNYGSAVTLSVKPSTDAGSNRSAFLRFDLSALQGAQVQSAVLSLDSQVLESGPATVRLDAHAVTGAWSESGLTYANAPALGATVSSLTADRTLAYRSGDVTGYTAALVSAGSSSMSLGVTQDSWYYSFGGIQSLVMSRESNYRPYIDVVIAPSPAAVVPAHILGSVSVSGVPAGMTLGQAASASYAVKDSTGLSMSSAGMTVSFVSSNSSVASVDSGGRVVAVAVGNATITVSVVSGDVTAKASIAVAVSDVTRFRIYASEDSYVQGGATASTNYGSAVTLSVKPSTDAGSNRSAFLRFDLSALQGAQVQSAVLSLDSQVLESGPATVRLDAHAVTGAWSESGLTYANAPALGATVSSLTADRTLAYRSGDVTGYTAALVSAGSSSMSLGVTQDSWYYSFGGIQSLVMSRESNYRPYIDVVIAPSPAAVVPAHILGSVSVSGVPAGMTLGQAASASYAVKDSTGLSMSSAGMTVSFVSSNSSVASVDSGGRVVAVAVGNATITVSVVSGDVTAKASIAVAVSDVTRFRIYASEDSYVQGGATASTNYGSAVTLSVKPSTDAGSNRSAFLRFDLSALQGAQVQSAVLSLDSQVLESGPATVRLDAHAVTGAWSESGLTYANAPALGATVSSLTADRTLAYRSGDVTGYTAALVSAGSSSMSLGVTQDSWYYSFGGIGTAIMSRESNYRPYIDVVIAP